MRLIERRKECLVSIDKQEVYQHSLMPFCCVMQCLKPILFFVHYEEVLRNGMLSLSDIVKHSDSMSE